MFARILVGLDGSEYASTAGDYALSLAAITDAHVLALHVVDIRVVEGPTLETLAPLWGEFQGAGLQTEALNALQERAREILERFAERARGRGISGVETALEIGLPAERIVERAASCELTVLGKRGEHARFGSTPLGSTTRETLRRGSHPVLVTPSDLGPMDRPIVAYDESDAAVHALDLATRYAESRALPLHVVHAGDGIDGDRVVERAREFLGGRSLEWQTHSVGGQPEVALARAFERLAGDCLFMGAYSGSRFHDWLMGSDTESILTRIEAPAFLTR